MGLLLALAVGVRLLGRPAQIGGWLWFGCWRLVWPWWRWGLGIKVALLRHGIKGLRRDLVERRGQDTNTLLSLPCRDRGAAAAGQRLE